MYFHVTLSNDEGRLKTDMVDEMAQHLWCRGLFHSLVNGLVSIERMVRVGRRCGMDIRSLALERMEPNHHQSPANRSLRTGSHT